MMVIEPKIAYLDLFKKIGPVFLGRYQKEISQAIKLAESLIQS